MGRFWLSKGAEGTRDSSLGARILSVVDCYDALTSDRPVPPRMTRQQAKQELRDRRGSVGTNRASVVDQFIEILDKLEESSEAAQRKTVF